MSKIIRSDVNIKSLSFAQISHELSREKGDDKEVADALIKEAKEKAELIIREAKERARLIEQDAYQKGYAEGLDLVNAEVSELVEAVRSVAESALSEKWSVINSYERNIVDLALEIAKKVVDGQILLKPDTVVGIARKALFIAAEREHIQIRVNPEDVEMIKAHKDDLMASMDGIEKIDVIADRRVKRGGCILETDAGNVDGRLQSQLSHIDDALKGVVSDG